MSDTQIDADVVVVGAGPVGQTLAVLLARQGRSVVVVERFREPYPRPRAVHFDDEIARVFAAAGLARQLPSLVEHGGHYHWQNAAGETLLDFDWTSEGPNGWCTANMFGQPALEATLSQLVGTLDDIDLRRGWRATSIVEHDDDVRLTVVDDTGAERELRSRYLVGCDGANSFVRGQMQTSTTDLGFYYDWLIVDVVVHDNREWEPVNLQVCDPVRPTTRVSGGPGKRRWEFMRLPHETIEELNTEETAWRLLAPWGLTPDDATLERHTVYTFQARWADTWREGRVLLAGDAAHLMPPFAGQGMCSGIRDVANLAWKLDLVLAGRAGDALLDTYTTERSAHVQHSIGMSVELGHVICLTDPAEVAARDEVMLKAGGRPELALPPIPPAVLGPGIAHATVTGELVGPAGQLFVQGRVRDAEGVTDRFDQLVGTGFVVLSRAPLGDTLDQDAADVVRRLGIRLVQVVEPGAPLVSASAGHGLVVEVVEDVEGTYGAWFDAGGYDAVVVRPDFYLFAAARSTVELPSLLDELAGRVGLVREELSAVG